MDFPKLISRNYRYRGPVESGKIINHDIEIDRAIKELTNSINNSYELFNLMVKDVMKDKYIDIKRVSKINKIIIDNMGVE